jgi:hypothetical protein
MRRLIQPLSEEFLYASPEAIRRHCRRVKPSGPLPAIKIKQIRREEKKHANRSN